MRTKKDTGVPILETNEIELKAEEVVRYYDPAILDTPSSTPVQGIVEKLVMEFGLGFYPNVDLGVTKLGSKILGKTIIKPLSIYVDQSLSDTDRFPFTLAHELGHTVFHRGVDIKKSGYEGQELTDEEHDFITGKKLLKTDRDWIEWQANRFASALLMPRTSVSSLVVECQQILGITRNVGQIILTEGGYSMRDYLSIQNQVKNIFEVNATNAEFRLKDLGILVDQRFLDTKHISQLFQTE